LISELKEPKDSNGISDLLKSGHQVIDQAGWEKINASEILSGEPHGKYRMKITSLAEFLKIANN
jgi:ferredoxin--NADP+ reductase